MAAPTVTALGVPAANKLRDGFSTRVTFSVDPTIEMYIKSVQPPAVDGGDMIDSTNMHNTTWRTGSPRSLATLTQATAKVAWNPISYQSVINSVLNKTGSVTYRFPDGSTLAVWAYLQKFEPSELTEGTEPEATITINHTNWDPNNHVEAGPAFTAGGGTGLD